MTRDDRKDNKRTPDVTPKRAEEQKARRDCLAGALRKNLRKRKSQQRKQNHERNASDQE